MKCIKENKFLKDHIIICKPDNSDNGLEELIEEIKEMPLDKLTKELKEAGIKLVNNKKIKKKKGR